jgi:hypothetical protein
VLRSKYQYDANFMSLFILLSLFLNLFSPWFMYVSTWQYVRLFPSGFRLLRMYVSKFIFFLKMNNNDALTYFVHDDDASACTYGSLFRWGHDGYTGAPLHASH